MHARGDSDRSIAARLGISRNTVARYVRMTDMSPVTPMLRNAPHPATDAWARLVMAWLRDDLAVPRKQRRTARKIYDDLVHDHGYVGSRSSVERLVRRIREDTTPAGDGYLELDWPAGIAQVDFGHAAAWLGGERTELHLLVMSFPHSNARFCVPPVSEAAECLCAGLRTLFEHVGGAPTELVLDNATEAGRRMCGVTRESALFSQFRAHYGCRSTYCNPYSGNEKGSVENAVGFLRRNLMSPPPAAPSLAVLASSLFAGCDRLLGEEHYRAHVVISEVFAEDRHALSALPGVGFDAVRWERRRADKQGCVTVGSVRYCAGPYWHDRWMLVGMRADGVEALDEHGRHAATLPRAWSDAGGTVRDPASLIPAPAARPRAWSESPLRADVPPVLRDVLDRADVAARRQVLRAVSATSDSFGFDVAVGAAAEVCVRGALPDAASVDMVARRMAAGRSDAGVTDLTVYDGFLREVDAS